MIIGKLIPAGSGFPGIGVALHDERLDGVLKLEQELEPEVPEPEAVAAN